MNLCGGRASVENSVYTTKISKFLKDLPHRNEISHFLILLNDQDFEKACPLFPSLRYRILHFNDFPGKLEVKRFSDVESLEYKIEDSPQPKQLYIKLPKEKLFIDIKNYEYRLLTSKMNEIINIFMDLGAIKIETAYFRENTENIEISGGVNVNINHIDVGTDNSYINNNTAVNYTKEMIEFPVRDNFELDVFKLYKNYYLPKMNEWQNIITRRVDGENQTINYMFTNKENKKLRRKLVEKLKCLNISVCYNYEECVDVMKSFNVTFNEIKAENIFYSQEEKDAKKKKKQAEEYENAYICWVPNWLSNYFVVSL